MLIQNKIRGGISRVMGYRYVVSDDNKKILYGDANNLCGHSMFQIVLFDEIEMWHGHPDLYMNKLEEILNSPEDNDIGCFVEVKAIPTDKHNDFMKKKTKPDNYTDNKKLICGWTDKKKYLIHYSMLKFYIKHGMIVEKLHGIISIKQSEGLVKI